MGQFTLVGGHVTACNSSSAKGGHFILLKYLPSFLFPQDYLVDRYLLGIEGRKLKIKNPTPVHLCMINPLATGFAE
jgi:hypothetical protein